MSIAREESLKKRLVTFSKGLTKPGSMPYRIRAAMIGYKNCDPDSFRVLAFFVYMKRMADKENIFYTATSKGDKFFGSRIDNVPPEALYDYCYAIYGDGYKILKIDGKFGLYAVEKPKPLKVNPVETLKDNVETDKPLRGSEDTYRITGKRLEELEEIEEMFKYLTDSSYTITLEETQSSRSYTRHARVVMPARGLEPFIRKELELPAETSVA